MRQVTRSLLILTLLVPAVTVAVGEEKDEDARTWTEAIKNGDLKIGLRYRLETVDDDAQSKEATASTLRTTLGYRSAAYRHFRIGLEVEDVTDIGADGLHDNKGAGGLSNGVSDRPAVADPDGTEFNAAYLLYGGFRETEIAVGRKELVLDDARFVGNVGWRQNHQSFDGVILQQGSIPRSDLTYAFFNNVNAITGANRGMDGHVLSVAVDAGAAGTVTPYFLHLDFNASPGASTRTIGASLVGDVDVDSWRLPYRVELAQQDDAADNSGKVDAGYLRLEIGAKKNGWSFGVGHETLEGSPSDGEFETPLATLHKFNGWADKFLNTPPDGLVDLYGKVGYKRNRWSALVVYHDFEADSGSDSYGTELDGVVSYRAPWDQLFAVKLARFDADDPAFTDADKLWAFTAYTF